MRLNNRNKDITVAILQGSTAESVAQKYQLTKERIRQIFKSVVFFIDQEISCKYYPAHGGDRHMGIYGIRKNHDMYFINKISNHKYPHCPHCQKEI